MSELRVETDLPTCDNCVESNSEWRSGVLGESISTSTTLGSRRSNGWIIDVALSNKELTNEALRSDLMLLRLSQSLIIYIGLSSVYLDALESLFLAFLLVLNASRVFACFRAASPPACLYLLYHKISQKALLWKVAALGWLCCVEGTYFPPLARPQTLFANIIKLGSIYAVSLLEL